MVKDLIKRKKVLITWANKANMGEIAGENPKYQNPSKNG